MASATSAKSNISWLQKQFDNNIEPKIKSHLPLTPDEVDLLMEYNEMKDNLEIEKAVEEAQESSFDAGCDAGREQAWDEAKGEIENQLSDVIDKYNESKAAIFVVLKEMMESVIWYRIKTSLDENETEHFQSLRKEIVGKQEEDILAYIEDIDKALYDEFVGDIRFSEVEHAFHQIF